MDFTVNAFEAFCVLVLMMAVFRFPIRSHLGSAILSSAIIAQSSYLIRMVFHMDSYAPLLVLLWLIVLLWLQFRVHLFYALLMSVTAYLGYIVIQALALLAVQIWIPVEQILSPLSHVKMFQTGCSLITLGIGLWLNRKRLGFIFVPDGTRVKVKLAGLNLIILVVCFASALLISGVALYILGGGFFTSLIGALFLLAVLVVVNLAYQREIAE